MEFKLLEMDVDAITFKGLSLTHQRKLSAALTGFIWLGLFMMTLALAPAMARHASTVETAFATYLLIEVAVYCMTGRSAIIRLIEVLVDLTPMGVLFRSDKRILSLGRDEVLKVCSEINLQDYLEYARINPEIRSKGSLLVMGHQQRGDLETWLDKPLNLKKASNLLYQIHQVEVFLEIDGRGGIGHYDKDCF